MEKDLEHGEESLREVLNASAPFIEQATSPEDRRLRVNAESEAMDWDKLFRDHGIPQDTSEVARRARKRLVRQIYEINKQNSQE